MPVILVILVILAGAVQFWILDAISQFNPRPPLLQITAGTGAFFLLALLAATHPQKSARRNVVLTALTAQVSGWILFMEELVNHSHRHLGPPEAFLI